MKLTLDSLAGQTDKNFNVIFVDYGSEAEFSHEVRRVVDSYSFCRYVYNDTRGMVWNRSHALNTAVRIAESSYVFTADIDMIFKPGFVEMLNKTASPDKCFFFSAIMLPEGELPGKPDKEKSYVRTTSVALGWGLIPTKALHDIGAYDEFYCIWGIEDNDIGHRLRMAGVEFNYVSDIWMFHYYHPSVPKQREILPEDWFSFLGDYFNLKKDLLVRNTDVNWGKLWNFNTRIALQALNDDSIEPVTIVGQSRFFRFALEDQLRAARDGAVIKAEFTDRVAMQFKTSRLSKWIAFVNSIFTKLHIPLKLRSDFEFNFEDIYNARNELMYLIISRSDIIGDYAFHIKGNTITVVLAKR